MVLSVLKWTFFISYSLSVFFLTIKAFIERDDYINSISEVTMLLFLFVAIFVFSVNITLLVALIELIY